MAQMSRNKCDTCPDGIGSSFCKECQEYLCEKCRTFHDKFTKGEHTVTDSQGVGKSVLKSKLFCEDHKRIFLHFCDNCKCLTCSKCTTSDHKGHLLTDIAEKANETREVLLETCKTLKAKSSALSDVIKQINKLQLTKIQESTERFKTAAQAISNDCKTMVNEVAEIRMNRANDYRVFELEHARFTLAKLQKQQDECKTECSKIEQFLQEKHDLTFYVQQRDLAQNADAMDEIPKIDEPNEIGTFENDEFLDDVVEKFQSKYKISLSKIAGEKRKEDNPFVTDLSDPNTPQGLAEKYNSLYDNSWTDSYEVLSSKNIDEESTCKQLIDIFKECLTYCSQLSKHQMSSMQQMAFLPDMKAQTNMVPVPEDILVSNIKLLRDARRSYARQFIPVLCNYYWDNILSKDVTREPQLKSFVNDCLELCWYSAITDPPLIYTFTAEVIEDFRGYTNKVDEVDYIVWPAMYLHEFGPILYQGVVQFKQGNKESK